MAFGQYLSYMNFGGMLPEGDVAWRGVENCAKIRQLADANCGVLKKFKLKSSFGGRSQGFSKKQGRINMVKAGILS